MATDQADPNVESEKRRLSLYHEVVDRAELVAVQLIKSSFEVKPSFFGSDEARKNIDYDVDVLSVDFSEERGAAMAHITCSVDSKVKRKKVLNCEARYLVVYDGLENCDGDAVEAFIRRVATFACYPYFRSHFANMDWAASTRLPPMPVLREPAKKTAKPQQADKTRLPN